MRTIIVDCSGLAYTSFFALGNRLSYEDEQTGVIFSFLREVFKAATIFESNKFVFCWDSGRNKRKVIYPEYKVKRKKKEQTEEEINRREALYIQMNKLRLKVLPAMGFKNNFIKTGYEADDLIAQVVMDYPGNIVISSDKDLFQLLNWCDLSLDKKSLFTKKDFCELYGIGPERWAEAKSIGGCNSDDVIGIKGAADPAKSLKSKALCYMKGELTKGKIFDRIEENKELIARNLPVVSLPFDDKIEIVLQEESFDLDDWVDVFDKYSFKSFLNKEYFTKLKKNFNL